MDPDTYQQLMICLKNVPRIEAPNERVDTGTFAKKVSKSKENLKANVRKKKKKKERREQFINEIDLIEIQIVNESLISSLVKIYQDTVEMKPWI